MQNYNNNINLYKNIAKKYNKVYNINRIKDRKSVVRERVWLKV